MFTDDQLKELELLLQQKENYRYIRIELHALYEIDAHQLNHLHYNVYSIIITTHRITIQH